jgi:hypothetical protein
VILLAVCWSIIATAEYGFGERPRALPCAKYLHSLQEGGYTVTQGWDPWNPNPPKIAVIKLEKKGQTDEEHGLLGRKWHQRERWELQYFLTEASIEQRGIEQLTFGKLSPPDGAEIVRVYYGEFVASHGDIETKPPLVGDWRLERTLSALPVDLQAARLVFPQYRRTSVSR